MNRSILIPNKHYVGTCAKNGSLPLAFITPYGDDKAAKKRMATVDKWAKLSTTVIDNIPMLGFKMTSGIRTGDYGAQDHWRIEDPRGFELEITSANLADLLSITTFDKGEILDECVWARNGSTNVLLSVESEEYQDAIKMTIISKTKASLKELKIGNDVTLTNGITGQYLGKYKFLKEKYRFDSNMFEILEYYAILDKTSKISSKTTTLHMIKSLKLSSINDNVLLSDLDAEIKINELLIDPLCYKFGQNTHGIYLASLDKFDITQIRVFLEETDINTRIPTPYSRDKIIARTIDNKLGKLNNDNNRNIGYELSEIDEAALLIGQYVPILKKPIMSYYNNGQLRESVIKLSDFSTITKLYNAYIEYKSKSGNTIIVKF